MEFHIAAFRFIFRALESVYFPPGKSANVFRGGLGAVLRKFACHPDCPGVRDCPLRSNCAYSRLFEPVFDSGPSGLADPPRPFVLRPRFGEGHHLASGAVLSLDVHLFDLCESSVPVLIAALAEVARTGLGPARGRTELQDVHTISIDGRPQVRVYARGQMQMRTLAPSIRIELNNTTPEVNRIRVEFTAPTEVKAQGDVVTRP